MAKSSLIRKYFYNCFLLTLPILIWNLALTNSLPKTFQPEIFWNTIPLFLAYGENTARTVVFILTLFMPLHIVTPTQRKGLLIYVSGLLIYFISWLLLIFFPSSAWSNSIIGFSAPAYTPLLWLTGIGLMGNSFYFSLPYKRWIFLTVSVIFLVFHNLHTCLIYYRTH
ncbi:hypothetical protein [Runella sp.]|uniref:hypothetical protein n=1 Tax=Runella sp. TaxID=1960881 RepID=UPI003D0E3230